MVCTLAAGGSRIQTCGPSPRLPPAGWPNDLGIYVVHPSERWAPEPGTGLTGGALEADRIINRHLRPSKLCPLPALEHLFVPQRLWSEPTRTAMSTGRRGERPNRKFLSDLDHVTPY
jgi:hypothetical protein